MAMTEQEILAGLGEIVDEVAGVPADQVTPDKSFVDDLDIDSLSMVEIAVAAQDKFGVEIPDDQLKNLKTVQDVVTYVRTPKYRPEPGRPLHGMPSGALSPPASQAHHVRKRSDSQCGQINHASSSPGWARPRRWAGT